MIYSSKNPFSEKNKSVYFCMAHGAVLNKQSTELASVTPRHRKGEIALGPLDAIIGRYIQAMK